MIREQILKDLKSVLVKLKIPSEKLILEHPAEVSFGDYSTNIALRISHKDFANPVDFANSIVNTWRATGLPEYLAKIEVVKPGFINLWLKKEFFVSQVEEVLKRKQKYGSSLAGRRKTVVIDYSGPNIAKPFGIGHLRSTNIGQALYNLYQFLGWRTIGDNHLGDWGTQFGKLIVAIRRWDVRGVKGGLRSGKLDIARLEKLYVKFHQEAEKNPELEDEARLWFKKLEGKDAEARKIWQGCVEVSLKEYERIYRLLGVKIDYAFGESFYVEEAAEVIARAKRNKIAVESQGALVIELPKIPPAMLLKSDEATTYLARDLAAIAYRQKRWQPDLFIYEVGAEQKLYFQQLFAAAKILNHEKRSQFVHIPHGLIRFSEGKMSTRMGKTIHLEDVFSQAIKKAKKIIQSSATDRGLGVRLKEKVAQAVGIGAVKYSDLKQNPQTDIVFDWERIFNLEGDSGPYLQYTYARCRSVLRKAAIKQLSNLAIKQSSNFSEEEVAILRTIYKFPELVEEAAENFSPNLVCAYLFDLAQKYNLMYNKLPILKSTKKVREARLALTAATAQVIKNGLTILGIEAIERM